mgnify:FL=1
MNQSNPDQIQRLARHLASLGRENAERLQLVVDEALRLLDDPELVIPEVQPEAFPWEQEEPEVSGPKGIYLATVTDDATGEGLTVYFAAVLARSESEARRSLSRHWTRNLAHLATLARGADAAVPYAELFLSPRLRAALERLENSGDRPAAFSYQARYHVNIS